jgi:uncharacterized membrane protein YqgA involved in biofilm formation
MTGTLLNAVGILLGGILGLTLKQPWTPAAQLAMKGLLGVATVYVGLRAVWLSLGGGFWMVGKQLIILVLALTLGRITGRWLRLQKGMNRCGQFARDKFARANPDSPQRFGEGFMTCTVLFCVAPLAILGAVQDGLGGQWQALAVKAVMDGLATMAFVKAFGWGAMVSAIPVVSFQGTVSLTARLAAPFLGAHGVLDSINTAAGMLVFCVALLILDIRRIEVGDYLPSLAFAPLLTWLWR